MKTASHILILEDHQIVASTLAAIVAETVHGSEVSIAGSFTKGIIMMQRGLLVDLVILDVHLPGGDLYNMIPTLRELQPEVRILVFTGNEEYATALHFLNAGANGYLTKSHPMEEISLAIRTVLNGQKYIADELKQIVSDNVFKLFSPVSIPDTIALSPREKEVLALLLDGKQTKQISTELNLKITTVSAHKARIFDKLQVGNVIELFKRMQWQS